MGGRTRDLEFSMGWFFEAASLAGWQLLVRVLAGVSGPAVGPRTRDLESLRLQAWLAGISTPALIRLLRPRRLLRVLMLLRLVRLVKLLRNLQGFEGF